MESSGTLPCAGKSTHGDFDDYADGYRIANTYARTFIYAYAYLFAYPYLHAQAKQDAAQHDYSDTMSEKAFQDYYPDHMAHCYGCGRLNEHGHQIKSFWDGEESVCYFQPSPAHISIPGYVYGGLLASLIDCHGTGTAAAAGYRAESRPMDSEPALRYLTASLHVDYLKPTPLGCTLEVRGRVKEVKGRKVTIEEWIVANGETTVRGEVVAVQVPDEMVQELLREYK